MTTWLDAAAAVHEWVNGQTSLVGPGNPLPLGAVFKQRDGAATAAYGFMVELSSVTWGGAEHSSMVGRVEMQIYGPTRESAADAARAYTEAVEQLTYGNRVALGSGVILLGADAIEGPRWFPDGDEPRYIVDADFLFE